MALILLIENSPLMRPTLRDLLQLEGHTVVIAQQGEDALDILSDLVGLDMILLDYAMPDMDGLELVRRLRADPEYETVPLLVYAVAGELNITQKALDAGADVCMTPPITVRALMNTVDQVLGGRMRTSWSRLGISQA